MRHIPQEHPLGCFIAAAAMVLDLEYSEVAETVPLQDVQALRETEVNILGLAAYDAVVQLATKQGKLVADLIAPFNCATQYRYIGILAPESETNHAVAIDEVGIVFDPEPSRSTSRRHWSEYEFAAIARIHPNNERVNKISPEQPPGVTRAVRICTDFHPIFAY